MSPKVSIVSVQGLWKVYGPGCDQILDSPQASLPKKELFQKTGCVVAVRDVSFDVYAGETFVVMGLSGCGKSTLIRCLSRLIEPSRAKITIDGEEVTSLSEAELRRLRRRKISMVFQHFGLFPHRCVLDNVAYGLEIQGVPKPDRIRRAEEVLQLVGLEEWKRSFPSELSGGMQQRVGLARALAVGPEILLFDEPFSALDPLIRRNMQDELIELQRVMKKTIIFITHDFVEALKLGDRIAIMKDGEFVQVGTAREVVTSPADQHVSDFTRDAPRHKVLLARDLMTEPALTVKLEGPITVDHVLTAMKGQVGSIACVVDHAGRYLGLVRAPDLSLLPAERLVDDREEWLSNAPAASPDTPLEQLAHLLIQSDLPIPIVDPTGLLLGLVDRKAVLSAFVEDHVRAE